MFSKYIHKYFAYEVVPSGLIMSIGKQSDSKDGSIKRFHLHREVRTVRCESAVSTSCN